MILNAPTSASLDAVALRLYFSAWSSLMEIQNDFHGYFDAAVFLGDKEDDEWSEERSEYLEACQVEFQSICAIVQQSNELALKAKICEVSPFLLLLKSDPRFSNKAGDIEFSDLRTLDAVDLPGAVNTFCATSLSDKFISTYSLFRSLRNKVIHLGSTDATFTPEGLIETMLFQYQELWPNRTWLKDWVEVESKTRLSYFHDYSNASPYAEVFARWPSALTAIGKSDFKRIFGFAKSQRRYMCPSCVALGSTDWNDLKAEDCHTAFLVKDTNTVRCTMCDKDWQVSRVHCAEANCKGNVTFAEPDHEDFGMCLTCGEHPIEADT